MYMARPTGAAAALARKPYPPCICKPRTTSAQYAALMPMLHRAPKTPPTPIHPLPPSYNLLNPAKQIVSPTLS